jgi:myosin V
MQSCIRRRLARKELKALKAEARSVSKFKEISYRLENKVVELTQTLQSRTQEKKELQVRLAELDQQVQQWMMKFDEADTRGKQLQTDLQAVHADLSRERELLKTKADVEKRLEDALNKVAERENAVQQMSDTLSRQAAQLDEQQKAIDSKPIRNTEDGSIIMTLKNEVSSLREQLNRANALNALTRGSRPEPTSPTFAPVLRVGEPSLVANGTTNGESDLSSAKSHQRRHSSAGVFSLASSDHRASVDELMISVKRNQSMNPRAVSVAYNGAENGLPRFRAPSGLTDISDDPAEEKIRLLTDSKHLDVDVLDGLIRGLKIPAPSLTTATPIKEILFPANLISLVTNEMWKYGLIPESERFLASVMQTIQSHVMVSHISACTQVAYVVI